ncbi:hypothetical protein OIU78_018960 [Salix suchowensis]|nr:hypothetical protein OIU78_018960 [Salix suchowensis]
MSSGEEDRFQSPAMQFLDQEPRPHEQLSVSRFVDVVLLFKPSFNTVPIPDCSKPATVPGPDGFKLTTSTTSSAAAFYHKPTFSGTFCLHFTTTTTTARYDNHGEKAWYFFTPRSRKYRNGTRPNRAAGGGYWKATGADKAVKYEKNVIGADNKIKIQKITVGQRKALVYYNGKAPKGEKTNWIMHEFRLDDPPLHVRNNRDDMRLDDCVLCMIYKKRGKRTNADTTVRVQQSNEENSSLMTIEGNDEDFINEHGYDPNRLSAIEASFAGEIHGTITPLENSFPVLEELSQQQTDPSGFPDASNLYTLQASPIPGLEEAFGTPAPMDFFNSEDWFYTQMEQRDEFLMSPANSSQYYNIPDQFVNLYPTMPTNLLTNPSPLVNIFPMNTAPAYGSLPPMSTAPLTAPLRPANPASTHPTSEMMNVAPNHPGQPPQHR